MAGTHGYGFGYFMEIERMIIEEQKPELIYRGGVRLNLHESGADGYTELYDNSI